MKRTSKRPTYFHSLMSGTVALCLHIILTRNLCSLGGRLTLVLVKLYVLESSHEWDQKMARISSRARYDKLILQCPLLPKSVHNLNPSSSTTYVSSSFAYAGNVLLLPEYPNTYSGISSQSWFQSFIWGLRCVREDCTETIQPDNVWYWSSSSNTISIHHQVLIPHVCLYTIMY